MTTCSQPATGSAVSHFYTVETDCGVTPASPVWRPIRFTSGVMAVTRDTLQSAELDGGREIADLRLGSKQTSGDISVELSYLAYTDLLESSMGSLFATGATEGGVSVQVLPLTKEFKRATGSFAAYNVGDIIKFGSLSADNNNVFIIKAITTGSNPNDTVEVIVPNGVTLTAETAVTTIKKPDTISIGVLRQSLSILTHYADADGGLGIYQLTKGVEIVGFTFDIAVNALVTGTFSTIGRETEFDVALPSGSTFPAVTAEEVYTSLQGALMENNQLLGYVTSLSITQDNAASAQFEIGSPNVSFIEKGRANNTLSLSTFFSDVSLLNKFLDETESSLTCMVSSANYTRSTAFKFPRIVYTSGSPEVAGEGSVVQNLDAQALKGDAGESSLQIQLIT